MFLVKPCWWLWITSFTCIFLYIAFARTCSTIFPMKHAGKARWSVVSCICLSSLLKIGIIFPDNSGFAWTPWLFKSDREHNSNNIRQFPQALGMHLIRPHRSVPVQFHQVVLNQLFTYRGRAMLLNRRFRDLRDVGSLTANDSWGGELVHNLSLLHIRCHQFSLLVYWGCTLLGLPFLTNVLAESFPLSLYIFHLFWLFFIFNWVKDRFGLVTQTLMPRSFRSLGFERVFTAYKSICFRGSSIRSWVGWCIYSTSL